METPGVSKPAVGMFTYPRDPFHRTVHTSYVAWTTEEGNSDLILAFRCSRLQGRQMCRVNELKVWLRGTALAQHVQGPGFKPQHKQRNNKHT